MLLSFAFCWVHVNILEQIEKKIVVSNPCLFLLLVAILLKDRVEAQGLDKMLENK